jgi:hypothetical protein
MARWRTPEEVWMVTPDEADFCPLIYPVRHIFSMKRVGASEGFCCGKGQNQKRP